MFGVRECKMWWGEEVMGWLRKWKYHLGNGKEADVSAKMKKKKGLKT